MRRDSKNWIDETIIANDWDQLIDWEGSKLIVSEKMNINDFIGFKARKMIMIYIPDCDFPSLFFCCKHGGLIDPFFLLLRV